VAGQALMHVGRRRGGLMENDMTLRDWTDNEIALYATFLADAIGPCCIMCRHAAVGSNRASIEGDEVTAWTWDECTDVHVNLRCERYPAQFAGTYTHHGVTGYRWEHPEVFCEDGCGEFALYAAWRERLRLDGEVANRNCASSTRRSATTTQLLTSDDVANLLVITARQATRMMNAGTLPTVRVTKSELRVPLEALHQWIAARITPSTSENTQE